MCLLSVDFIPTSFLEDVSEPVYKKKHICYASCLWLLLACLLLSGLPFVHPTWVTLKGGFVKDSLLPISALLFPYVVGMLARLGEA